jgi:HlyD family secretion protein
VVTLLVKAGDLVREGQTMARIESPELQNLLEQERSVLLSMKSELERIEIANQQIDKQNQQEVALLSVKLRANDRALERAKSLHEEGLASSIDYQKAEDDVEVARLELTHAKEKSLLAKETMEFELRTKELELRRQELVVTDMERKNSELAVSSPVAGLVSGVEVRDKDTVQASQALFSVVDLSEFEVEVFIPENYADEIAPETRAVVQYEGENYEGIVKSLSPEVENSQVKGVVVFTGVAPSGLKQNQRVYTRLILDSRPDVLKLPRGPFLESMGGRQAYVVEGDVATLRSIETGAVSVTEIEILSGLIEGEEAILSDLTRFDGVDTILLRR